MTVGPEWPLIAAVGVLHAIVPDHWGPIKLIGDRLLGWGRR
jgi:hypothetical protein